MPIHGIVLYSLRAIAIALPVAVGALICKMRYGKAVGEVRSGQEMRLFFGFVFYCAALFAITAIRDGAHLWDWWQLPHDLHTVQLIPVVTTLQEAKNGVWAILYPILGNLFWFLPFGIFLDILHPTQRGRTVLLKSASVSCLIEFLQWLFLSGISDIDDVFLNICGAWLGYRVHKAISKKREKIKSLQ